MRRVPLVTGLALLLLLISTYLLAEQRYVWDAALLLTIALLGLVGISLWREPGQSRVVAWARALRPRSVWTGTRMAALLLSAIVALAARARPATESFGPLVAIWLAAVLLFLCTVAGPVLRCPASGGRLSSRECWGLIALVVAAFLVRCVFVGRIPTNLGGDEGTQLVAALEIVSAPMGNPFSTGWYSVPTMSFAAYGAAMRLFGATVAGGRMLSVLIGTLTVLTTFSLARTVGGRLVGWAAAVTLACSAYHIHFSRLASNQVADPLFATLALWLVWRAIVPEASICAARPAHWRWVGRLGSGTAASEGLWGLAGVVAGLGWYAYFGARWVTVFVALVVLWRGLADRTLLPRHWRGLVLFGVGWLVVTLPLWGWYVAHPTTLYERYSAVGVFSSGWMEREQLLTGRSLVSLTMRQIWRSLTAFHLTHDPTFWYRPGQPLIDFVTGALVLVGLADAVVRARWPSRGLAHIWFWSGLTTAWVLTENPPSSQRGLLLLPPVALFAGWGIERLSILLRVPCRCWPVVASVLLTLAVAVNVAFYFGVYTPTEVYGNPSAQTATRFAAYMRANPEPICESGGAIECKGQVYFLGPPWLYWNFGSLAFLLRGYPGVDVAQGELPAAVEAPARFAVVPERSEQMADIRARWPGGTETELHAPDGRLLIRIYDLRGGD